MLCFHNNYHVQKMCSTEKTQLEPVVRDDLSEDILA